MSERRRDELADFLRTRRARVQPADVGLPPTGRRRTPRLRREELATLAGISATWYTYLEQGRDIRVSEQVLEALAGPLNLDTQDREHLIPLAFGGAPGNGGTPVQHLSPSIVRIVEPLNPNPAYVINARYDVLGHNRAAAALFTDFSALPAERRNLAHWVFLDPAARAVLGDDWAALRAACG